MDSAKVIIKRMLEISNTANNKDLSDLLSVSYNTLNTWLKRDNIPMDKINEFVQKRQLSYDWLLTGKGEILSSKKQNTQNSATQEQTRAQNLVNIPYFEDTYAAAGHGAINYESAPSVISFDFEFLKGILGISSFRHLHIIKAIGDSMEPIISSGEMLFINPIENDGNSITSGGVYVIRYYDDYLVKRVDRNSKTKELTLISENSAYSNVHIAGEDLEYCTIIGRVVGHFDRI